jgi:hypothetical protein
MESEMERPGKESENQGILPVVFDSHLHVLVRDPLNGDLYVTLLLMNLGPNLRVRVDSYSSSNAWIHTTSSRMIRSTGTSTADTRRQKTC